MNISRIVKVMVVSGLAASALLGGVALVPGTVAQAESTQVETVAPQSPAAAPAPVRLRNLFQVEQKLHTAQGKRLDNTTRVISATQQFIDRQNAQGNDTTPLVSALNVYTAAVEQAREEYVKAQGIIDTRAGFDGSGTVTDATLARQTVKDAGAQLRLFHLTMRRARIVLHTAIREFRLAHRPSA